MMPRFGMKTAEHSSEMLQDRTRDWVEQHFCLRVSNLISKKEVVVFMKGTPDASLCTSSKKMVKFLETQSVQFDFHNVLQDQTLWRDVKEYSGHPFMPQLFINGDFIACFDSMVEDGSLVEKLQKLGLKGT